MKTSDFEYALSIHREAWAARAAGIRALSTAGLSLEDRLSLQAEAAQFAVPIPSIGESANHHEREAFVETHSRVWRWHAEHGGAERVKRDFMGNPELMITFMTGAFLGHS